MSNVIHFFDPSPLRGLLASERASAHRYPDTPPPEGRYLELLDARLDPCGIVVLTLQAEGEEARDWQGLEGVLEGDDGSLTLQLGPADYLVFAPGDRERVSGIILKLANAQF